MDGEDDCRRRQTTSEGLNPASDTYSRRFDGGLIARHQFLRDRLVCWSLSHSLLAPISLLQFAEDSAMAVAELDDMADLAECIRKQET